MSKSPRFMQLVHTLRQAPQAIAKIHGGEEYPHLCGHVYFYQTNHGVLVAADIIGLPTSAKHCGNRIFAFHIHSGNSCAGTHDDMFANSMGHYNPDNCPHPHHAGDLPPLFENNGCAFQVFLTDRFCVRNIIGRTVIIHSGPDDFTTQPSGNSGTKIACGEIKSCWR